MPNCTKKEFAERCKMNTRALSVYIKRGQVIADGETIDEGNAVNVLFLAKKSGKPSLKQKITPAPRSHAPKQNPVKLTSAQKKEVSKQKEKADAFFEVEKAKKELQVAALQLSIEESRMKLAKSQGQVLPFVVVKKLFIAHSESMKTNYGNASEDLILMVAKMRDFSAEEIAGLRSQLVGIVNRALDSSITATERSLDKIAEEFSNKRTVGQHG